MRGGRQRSRVSECGETKCWKMTEREQCAKMKLNVAVKGTGKEAQTGREARGGDANKRIGGKVYRLGGDKEQTMGRNMGQSWQRT